MAVSRTSFQAGQSGYPFATSTSFEPGNPSRALLNEPDIERAVELRKAGWLLKDIARELDVGLWCIYKLVTGKSFGGRGKVDVGRRRFSRPRG